jgi:ferrous iron transport protein A
MSSTNTSSVKTRFLGQLNPGATAKIISVGNFGECDAELVRRLLEMGLLEGAEVEVLHQAPFGGDPLAVRVRGSVVALRRNEANYVEVSVVNHE